MASQISKADQWNICVRYSSFFIAGANEFACIERVIFGESESVYGTVPPKLKARLTTVVQELRSAHIPIWLYILGIP